MGKVNCGSFGEVFVRHAVARPENTALVEVSRGRDEDRGVTYGQLRAYADYVAAKLIDRKASSERAILLLPSGIEYVAALLGCLFSGTIAVPSAPANRANGLVRLMRIVRDCNARFVIGMATTIDRAQRLANESDLDLNVKWLDISELMAPAADHAGSVTISLDTIAVLQYTSGSTSDPKGVVVRHGNILANQALMANAFGNNIDTTIVGWVPLFHDMGLFGSVLQSFYVGGRSILMSEGQFLGRPTRWLDAISKHRATSSAAPNFAYDMCVRATPDEYLSNLDLSSWKIAAVGAEPIRPATLERFARKFGPCGFSPTSFVPCYGLAEATLLVTSANPKTAPTILETDQTHLATQVPHEGAKMRPRYVGCGWTAPDTSILIVDPVNLIPLANGEVGEVWVSGPSIAQSYWNSNSATNSPFGKTLPSEDGSFLRTGDFGFVQNKQLYIVGRDSDRMVIRGVNIYATDVEGLIAGIHRDLEPDSCAAFSIEFDEEERLVAVQAIKRRIRTALPTIAREIRRKIVEETGINPYDVALLAPGSVPKTTSGKIQRSRCRELYESGSLPVLYSDGDVLLSPERVATEGRTPLERQILSIWETVLKVEHMDVDDDFFSLGGDSIDAVRIAEMTSNLAGRDIDVLTVLDARTVKRLATCVSSARPQQQRAIATPTRCANHGDQNIPVSANQTSVWLGTNALTDEYAYCEQAIIEFEGALDHARLTNAIQIIIGRHDCMRAKFHLNGNALSQNFQTDFHLSNALEFISRSTYEENIPEEIKRLSNAERGMVKDIFKWPLFRVCVYEPTADQTFLIFTVHHIISDWDSLQIFVRELSRLYSASGPEEGLVIPASYRDFVNRQARILSQDEQSNILAWTGRLRRADLETRFSARRGHGGSAHARVILSKSTVTALRFFSEEAGYTRFNVLTAALCSSIAAYFGRERFLVGIPISDRDEPTYKGTIGLFVKTLPLPVDADNSKTFFQLLDSLKERIAFAIRHKDVSVERLQSAMRSINPKARSTFFEITCSMHRLEQWPNFDGLIPRLVPADDAIPKVPLEMTLLLASESIEVGINGIGAPVIQKYAETLSTVFESYVIRLTEEPTAPISSLPFECKARKELPQSTRETSFPLTPSQLLVYAGAELYPELPIYNIGCAFLIDINLDLRVFREVVETILDEHSAFRLAVDTSEQFPRLMYPENRGISLDYRDFSIEGDWSTQLDAYLRSLSTKKFDLHSHLFETSIVKLREDKYAWCSVAHHLIADGTVFTILLEEASALYSQILNDEKITYKPDSYEDHVNRELRLVESQGYAQAKRYWDKKLRLPVDRLFLYGTRPTANARRTDRVSYTFTPDQYSRLKALGGNSEYFRKNEWITTSNLLVSLILAYLHLATNANNIAIGLTFHNRDRRQDGRTIGLLMRELPIRVSVQKNDTLSSLYKKTSEEIFETYEHRSAPIGNSPTSPHYEVVFNYFDATHPSYQVRPISFAGSRVVVERLNPGCGLDPISINVMEASSERHIKVLFDLDADAFGSRERSLLVDHFSRTVEFLLCCTQAPLSDICLLSEQEHISLALQSVQQQTFVGKTWSVWENFTDAATKYPGRLAIVRETIHLTFQSLYSQISRLGEVLMSKGIPPGTAIGVLGTANENVVISAMAIWRAGCIFVPLDSSLPEERIRTMLREANVGLLMMANRDAGSLKPTYEVDTMDVVEELASLSLPPIRAEECSLSLDTSAYIVFTSGTTGQPKGVLVSHRNLAAALGAWICDYDLGTDHLVHMNVTSISFDVFIGNFVRALCTGSTLVLCARDAFIDPQQWYSVLRNERVNMLECTPSLLRHLVRGMRSSDLKLPDIRTLIVGGEPWLTSEMLEARQVFGDSIELINSYGVTEATIDNLFYRLPEGTERRILRSHFVPIGRPYAHTNAFVLDERLRFVPTGVPGMLYLGGPCISTGYVNDPSLSSDRFMQVDVSGVGRQTLYKTGDVVRRLPEYEGTLEFLGRNDLQVKLGGNRFEVEEIESQLRAIPNIQDAVVELLTDERNHATLQAYLVLREGTPQMEVDEIRSHLGLLLPSYAIPTSYILIDEIPLTSNYKIDRARLTHLRDKTKLSRAVAYAKPNTTLEARLAAIWCAILCLPHVGVDESFFALGGDSIQLMEMISRARDEGIYATPRVVFRNPTISGILTNVDDEREPRAVCIKPSSSESFPLTPIQDWFFEQNLRNPNHFNQSVLFDIPQRLALENVNDAFCAVTDAHEGFRLRFRYHNGIWRQVRNRTIDSQELFPISHIRADTEEEQLRHINELHRSLSIHDGPLASGALFTCEGSERKQMFLTIHHLIVDAVSWRVILRQFEKACGLIRREVEAVLAPETVSFSSWALELSQRAEAGEFDREVYRWCDALKGNTLQLPFDFDSNSEVTAFASVAVRRTSISGIDGLTSSHTLRSGRRVGIREILLFAVSQAIIQWIGKRTFAIDLEGHGREPLGSIQPLDTVGWFTTVFPVCFDFRDRDSMEGMLNEIADQLCAIPRGGLGYCVLRYTRRNRHLLDVVAEYGTPSFCVNFLGNFDDAVPLLSNGRLQISPGNQRDPRGERIHAMALTAIVLNRNLEIELSFSAGHFRSETIDNFLHSVDQEIRWCLSQLELDNSARNPLPPETNAHLNLAPKDSHVR